MTKAQAKLLSSNEDLRIALTIVYRVFSNYRMSTSMAASPLRDLDAIQKDLLSAPLVQLPPDALGRSDDLTN